MTCCPAPFTSTFFPPPLKEMAFPVTTTEKPYLLSHQAHIGPAIPAPQIRIVFVRSMVNVPVVVMSTATVSAPSLGHKDPTCHDVLNSCHTGPAPCILAPCLFSATLRLDWEDSDLVLRPMITIGAAGLDMAATAGDDSHQVDSRTEAGFHHYRKGQFLLRMCGVLTCAVTGSFWLVPPGSAFWVPGGVEHRMETPAGTIECYVVYVDLAVGPALPRDCCTLPTTPLLRELVIRSAALSMRYEEGAWRRK